MAHLESSMIRLFLLRLLGGVPLRQYIQLQDAARAEQFASTRDRLIVEAIRHTVSETAKVAAK